MFPQGSEGFDMSQLLQQAQQMQAQLMSTQQDLAESESVGTSGGGLVRATVTGAGELRALEIDPSVVDPADVDTLADLVIAAVRDAQAQNQQRAGEQLGAISPGLEGLLGGGAAGADQSPLAGLFGGAAPELSAPDVDEDDDASGAVGPDDDGRGAPRTPGQ